EQVLLNLAINSRDAMPRGGKLVIQTANAEVDRTEALRLGLLHAGLYVVLSVTDTGPGIDEAARDHLFEPFFTTKEQGKGTGIWFEVCCVRTAIMCWKPVTAWRHSRLSEITPTAFILSSRIW